MSVPEKYFIKNTKIILTIFPLSGLMKEKNVRNWYTVTPSE